MGHVCIIDAREDGHLANPFLKLVMIGKPAVIYPVQAAAESALFDRVIVLTDSEEIAFIARRAFREKIDVIRSAKMPDPESLRNSYGLPDSVCRLSGRAALITAKTIQRAYSQWHDSDERLESVKRFYETDFDSDSVSFLRTDNELTVAVNVLVIYRPGRPGYSHQDFLLTEEEALVLNNRLDFELALYCIDRRGRGAFLMNSFESSILRRKSVFEGMGEPKDNVCLVGHSQFEYWNIKELAGLSVRNCGIAGINSYNYKNLITDKGLLSCNSRAFIVMHGVNDLGRPLDTVSSEILDMIRYIRSRNTTAPILFAGCIHTNGRMDRTNAAIDAFNERMRNDLPSYVTYVDTSSLDDDFGNLDLPCTRDGLHLTAEGYRRLGELLEQALRQALV